MKTSTRFSIIISILIIIPLVFFSIQYSIFKNYTSSEFNDLRIYLSQNLQNYYLDYNTKPKSIKYFIENLLEQQDSEMDLLSVKSIDYLMDEKDNLRIKQISDTNLLVIYHIGFDDVDNRYEGEIIDYDSLTFFQFLMKPEGDINITWTSYITICEGERINYLFYKDGLLTKPIEIRDIMFDTVYPEVRKHIAEKYARTDTIFLLYKYKYLNFMWDGELVCNWEDIDSSFTTEVQQNFLKQLNTSRLDMYADSMYFPFVYNGQVREKYLEKDYYLPLY